MDKKVALLIELTKEVFKELKIITDN